MDNMVSMVNMMCLCGKYVFIVVYYIDMSRI